MTRSWASRLTSCASGTVRGRDSILRIEELAAIASDAMTNGGFSSLDALLPKRQEFLAERVIDQQYSNTGRFSCVTADPSREPAQMASESSIISP